MITTDADVRKTALHIKIRSPAETVETVGQNSAVLQGGVAQGAAEGGVRGGRGRAAVGEALGLGEPARHVYTAWRLWPDAGAVLLIKCSLPHPTVSSEMLCFYQNLTSTDLLCPS